MYFSVALEILLDDVIREGGSTGESDVMEALEESRADQVRVQ